VVDNNVIRFFVFGTPAPAGSKNAFLNKKTGKINVTESNKRSKPWRSCVAAEAQEVMQDREILTGPIRLTVTYVFPRPRHHYGTGKKAWIIKARAPHYHLVAPDLTKLNRALEDALKGICWRDDSLVAYQRTVKVYAHHRSVPGAHVTIEPLTEPPGTLLDTTQVLLNPADDSVS
jgi:hypothetical protein